VADFAFFDLLSPALSRIDYVLSSGLALDPVWRIAIFAALGSIASMSVFKGLSNQVELAGDQCRAKGVGQVGFGGGSP